MSDSTSRGDTRASGGAGTAASADTLFSWRFTVPLYLGSALNPVNSSLLATALVPIAHGLQVPIGRTAALVTGLYVATAVAQPTAGKAANVFGPRRVFLAGLVLVATGGLVGGLAPNLITLVVSRVLIGLGTSCAYPTAMLLVRARADDAGLDDPPGNVLGGLQIAGIATASLGLPVGGLLVGTLGWRSIFFLNVPIALVTAVATYAGVPADRPVDRPRRTAQIAAQLDALGIGAFAAATTTVLLFLFALPTTHWYLLGVSVVLWAALIGWELRAASPFLDIRLLVSHAALTRTYVRFGLVMLCIYTVLYGITQWVQAVRGLSETASGLLLLPMTLISGLAVAPIAKRNLVRAPSIIAALLSLLASAGVLLLSGSGWIGWVVVVTAVFGVAQGAAGAANQTALYVQAPADQLGTAAGLLRTFGYVGSIASSAITGVVFRSEVSDRGVHTIALIMIGVSLALVLLTITDHVLLRKPD